MLVGTCVFLGETFPVTAHSMREALREVHLRHAQSGEDVPRKRYVLAKLLAPKYEEVQMVDALAFATGKTLSEEEKECFKLIQTRWRAVLQNVGTSGPPDYRGLEFQCQSEILACVPRSVRNAGAVGCAPRDGAQQSSHSSTEKTPRVV